MDTCLTSIPNVSGKKTQACLFVCLFLGTVLLLLSCATLGLNCFMSREWSFSLILAFNSGMALNLICQLNTYKYLPKFIRKENFHSLFLRVWKEILSVSLDGIVKEYEI